MTGIKIPQSEVPQAEVVVLDVDLVRHLLEQGLTTAQRAVVEHLGSLPDFTDDRPFNFGRQAKAVATLESIGLIELEPYVVDLTPRVKIRLTRHPGLDLAAILGVAQAADDGGAMLTEAKSGMTIRVDDDDPSSYRIEGNVARSVVS